MVFSQLCLLFGGFRSWLQGRISEQYTRFSYSSVIRPWQLLKPPIPDKAESIWFERKNPWISRLVALFLLEGGSIWPPPVSFFYITICLRLLKFSDFSYIPKVLPLGLKPGFNINCLCPQAHCLNDCFSCNKLNLCFDPLPLVRFW